MNTFKNIEELKRTFVSGNFDFPESFHVGGDGSNAHAEYRQHTVVNHNIEDMMSKGVKPMWVYSLRPSEENTQAAQSMGLNSWIVLLWGMDPKHRILPYDTRTITKSRATMTSHRSEQALPEDYKEVSQDRVIPDKVRIMLLDMPVARELIGKVDTGADVCSLHAEDVKIQHGNQKVSFRCPPLSDNIITVPLVDQQAVQTPSAEGTHYRPVISLNLKVADKALKDIRVNLNDRSNMDHPFLVGQNALEAGNFLIDPNLIKEDTDLSDEDFIQDLVEQYSHENFTFEQETIITEEQISNMYDVFESSDISLSDLIKILRTETMNRLTKIEY